MPEENRPSGASERPEEGGRDPWAPPERVRLSKQPGGVADRPTVSSVPGGGAPGPPRGAYAPVGPPPPAPGYSASGGYSQGAYAGYGAYGGYRGYGGAGVAWAGAPLPQGSAVASMVLGIVALVLTLTCWGSFLGILVAPVALVLGVRARGKADRGEAGGRGYATSGFVMGIVGTALSALAVVFLIWVLTHTEELENDPFDPYDSGYQDARARTPAAADV